MCGRGCHERCVGASSSPTGMGVSTRACEPLDGQVQAVRPRHRRGWESQQRRRSRAARSRMCVLVTDGDGSLNWSRVARVAVASVRPRHRRGWESQLDAGCVDLDRVRGASSSPTGMGVSTRRCAATSATLARVRPRHRRGWESQLDLHGVLLRCGLGASSSPTGMGVSTATTCTPPRGDRRGASSSPTGMGVSTQATETAD